MHTNISTRRQFLQATAAAAAAAAALAIAPIARASHAAPPNVLLILVDDLGYGDLACYGAKDMRTPHIDALAAAGMRFDNFYANCPVCSPTRASLLTGRYPDMVGVPGVIRTHIADSWGYLDPRAVTLPQILKRAGYHTAIVGKWHLGLASPNKPNERGFDHFHGYLGDMMDDYYKHRRHGFNYMRLNDKEIDPPEHATDLFSQWASDYIKDRAEKKDPWLLYLAYNAPHTPIQPPQEWVDKVTQREKNIDGRRAKLVALIEHMDQGIGQVLTALKQSGAADNTLVIFASDNGGQTNVGANNGPLTGGKQSMYEGGIKVPACAVWPGKIKPGSRSNRLALTMDILPTICEATAVRINHTIDGASILPTMLGEDQPEEDRTVFWVRREGGQYNGRPYYAARIGDFKIFQNTPFEPMTLVNLKDDPAEQTPLPKSHPMYKKLATAIQNHITESGSIPFQKHPVNLKQPYTH